MKLLLLLLILFSAQLHSQTSSLKELEEKRQGIRQEIDILQDSLSTINGKIAEFPIKDLSGPIRAYALEGATLRKEPSKQGEKIIILEKQTSLQVIDIIGNFYLVCFSGECGYLHKKEIRRSLPPSYPTKRS
ncbi:SH3 domain-containing protein [Salinimicrobium sediminilitoris]|uniref:SH3 domain-containing protein n=1 Tax=Salinimicrobium sediminilitoris TaxID=2876715 RepID=UPI001E52AC12|nr:SH3 domain-containing protein [Salinimicrobium sediminilitoris]